MIATEPSGLEISSGQNTHSCISGQAFKLVREVITDGVPGRGSSRLAPTTCTCPSHPWLRVLRCLLRRCRARRPQGEVGHPSSRDCVPHGNTLEVCEYEQTATASVTSGQALYQYSCTSIPSPQERKSCASLAASLGHRAILWDTANQLSRSCHARLAACTSLANSNQNRHCAQLAMKPFGSTIG